METDREEYGVVSSGYEDDRVEHTATEPENAGRWSPPPEGEHERGNPAMPTFIQHELTPVLMAAQEAAAQIVERARDATRAQTEEADRLVRQAQAQSAQITAWMDQFEPVLRAIREKMEDLQGSIQDLPGLIQAALDPVARGVSTLEPLLAQMSSMTRVPTDPEQMPEQPQVSPGYQESTPEGSY
jgi:hypothetical protein